MKVRLLVLVLVSLLFNLAPVMARKKPPTFIRDDKAMRFLPRLVITYWCGPPGTETTADRYAEVRRAGFNVAMPPCSGTSPEVNRKILAEADRQHMVAFVQDPRMPLRITGEKDAIARIDAIVRAYRDAPGMGGYFIADEPGAGAFDGLAEVVKALRERDRDHPAYINLFPNYASPEQMGVPTYDEYVRRFISVVQPSFVSYDHYHFLTGGDRPTFFENLNTVRTAALDSRLPFWNIVLLTAHGPYRDLTEGEIRWEAFQSLAYGARGIVYFTYWTPHDPTMNFRLGAISEEGATTHHYEMLRTVNSETNILGQMVARLQPGRVYHSGAVPPGTSAIPVDAPLVPDHGDFTIGEFMDYYHRRSLLVVNGDYKAAHEVSVRVAPFVDHMDQYDPLTGGWRRIVIPPGHRYISVSFSAGGATLFRIR